MCEPGTCEDCCSTDEWIVPSGLTSPETARPATQARREPEPVHAPTLTADGFTGALRALGRDGGERPEPEGVNAVEDAPADDGLAEWERELLRPATFAPYPPTEGEADE